MLITCCLPVLVAPRFYDFFCTVPLESPAPKQPRPAAAPAPVQLREEDQQLLREKEAAIAQVRP